MRWNKRVGLYIAGVVTSHSIRRTWHSLIRPKSTPQDVPQAVCPTLSACPLTLQKTLILPMSLHFEVKLLVSPPFLLYETLILHILVLSS